MSTQSSSWYIPGGGKQPAGPFTAEQIIQWWKVGRLDVNTICWRDGMAQWLPLSQTEPFATAIRQATSAGQVVGDSTTSRVLPTTQPSQSAPPVRQADRIDTASRTPIALRLLPFIISFVLIVALGMAYLLLGGIQRNNGRSTPSQKTTSRLPSTKSHSSGTDQGKIDDIVGSTNQQAEGVASSESITQAGAKRRFSDTVAFYEKGGEILELKKDGTFYLDKSLYRAIYRNDARHRRGRQSESDLLEEGRKGETFPSIDSDGVSGQWRRDEGVIILATGSGMSLRLVRKGDKELAAEGRYGARWWQWQNWEDNWNRLQRSREEVGIRQPGQNNALLKPTVESNMAQPSTPRGRSRKQQENDARVQHGSQSRQTTEPRAGRSSPAPIARNELEQVAGVRTVPRFIEPPLKCACPCWSPDGKYVMFVARPTEHAGGIISKGWGDSGVLPGNVWVISADGVKRWLVSNFFFGRLRPPDGHQADPLQLDVASAAWSPDGKKIAFSVGRYQVYVMNADATDIYQLVDAQGWSYGDTLQWASDGKGVLLGGHSGFCIHKLDGAASLPLAVPDRGKLTQPCISPNGNRVAGIIEDGAEMGLCVMNRDSRQVKWLTRRERFGGLGVTFSPRSWSPDAKQIAIHGNNLTLDMFVAIVNVTTGTVRRLTEGAAPSWSPDGKWIAFQGGIGDCGNIYLIGPDGKNLRRITNLTPPGVCMVWGSQPRCSPDGKQIVFRRGEHVWAANLDGSGETCVVQGTDYSSGYEHAPSWPCKWAPLWRPDGSVVFARFFKRDYPLEIEVCATAVNGGRASRVFAWKSPTVAAKSPDDPDDLCWSPDGTKLAFDNNQNIWVAKGDGTGHKRLVGGRNPRWSPDGEKILFARGSEQNEVLCIVNADGSNQTQITDPSDGYRAHHCWCSDGKTVAFEGKNGLFIVPAGGGNARRLVWGQQPCWSPDGKKLAFCAMGRLTGDSVASGPPCVYVMNADGTEMRPVMQVDSTSYGNNLVSYLSWSADGKHLVFEETARKGYDYENQHHIWIVDVSEPVFYQSSYVASELLAWKVPQFEVAPTKSVSSGMAEEEPPTRGAKQPPPAVENATDQGPLSGTWQASTGAQFRFEDDGKTVTIELISSSVLQEYSGKLTRGNKGLDAKALTGTVDVVFKPDAPRRYSIRLTAILNDPNHLTLRCTDWPVWNNAGRNIGKKIFKETLTRSNGGSTEDSRQDDPFAPGTVGPRSK